MDKKIAIYISNISAKSFDQNGDSFDLLNRKIILASIEGRFSNKIYLGEIYRILDSNKNNLDKEFESNVSDKKNKEGLNNAHQILVELNEYLIKNSYKTTLINNCLSFNWDD